MLYILFRPAAGRRLINLDGWERERIADEIIFLSDDPRPPYARRVRGETYEIWVTGRRIVYRVIRLEENDIAIIIQKIT